MSGGMWYLSNPAARDGKSVRGIGQAVARLRERGATVRHVAGQDAGQARALARQAVRQGVETLVVAGGDGIVNIALQELVGSQTRLGIIPLGTGNDVARSLGLPLDDPAAAADRVLAGGAARMDVAVAGDRYFLTALCTGFDAAVNARANRMRWPDGHHRYTLAILAEIASFTRRRYTIVTDGTTLQREAMMVTVANGRTIGGGIRIADDAYFDDGELDVVIIDPVSRWELIRMLPRLRDGSIRDHRSYHRIRARVVAVEATTLAGEPVPFYADGEPFGSSAVAVGVLPGALTVLC